MSAAPARIVVVGAGETASALAGALGSDGAPTELVAGLPAAGAALGPELGLVVEASPDAPEDAKREAVTALLAALPGQVPLAIATRRHRLAPLAPAPRHASRVVGLHLVASAAGDQPAVAEIAMPAAFDDVLVDAVLTLLEARGIVALPTGDAPGRIVDRLVGATWLEAHAAATRGASQDDLAAALAATGLSLAAIPPEDAPSIVGAIHRALGEPDRFAIGGDGSAGTSAPAPSRTVETIAERLTLTAIAEAYRLVEEAVAGADEIERAMSLGAGWSAGPFTLAGRRGLRAVVTTLATIAHDPAEDEAARDRFAIPRLLWTMATV